MDKRSLPAVMRLLKREYERGQAPIVELIQARTLDPFQVLVATILSARTLDQTTAVVCRRLFSQVRSLADLATIPQGQLEKLLYPVGFYRMKARHLKKLPAAVESLFDGVIPATVEELIKLPGVGRKTANLVVAVAFDKPAICVDVHVHRITNRWDLVATRTPLETEMALRGTLPLRYWRQFNTQVVAFGQSVCRPLRPHCSRCVLRPYCRRVGVVDSR